MPSMYVFGRLQTRPFGSDDLQLPCIICGIFRVLQIFCTFSLWIFLIVRKWRGGGAATKSRYCGKFDGDGRLLAGLFTNSTEPDVEEHGGMDGRKWLYAYVVTSFSYMIMDLALLVAIWKAASVGTPTQPRGREKFLRPLLRFKIVVMTIFLAGCVVVGILLVFLNRRGDFGCNYKNAFDNLFDLPADNNERWEHLWEKTTQGADFENSGWYVLFCIILVTQALELMVWPGIVAKKVLRWIKRNERLQNSTAARAAFGEKLIGGCLQCCGICCCFKSGGRELGANMNGQLRDAVGAMLDFINVEGLNVVLSDLYVSFRMLARVQAERKHDCVGKMLKLATTANVERGIDGKIEVTVAAGLGDEVELSDLPGVMTEPPLVQECNQSDSSDSSFYSARQDAEPEGSQNETQLRAKFSRAGSVFALELDGDELRYRARSRSIMSPATKTDIVIMREVAHFIRHSNAIYDYLPEYVNKMSSLHICGVQLPLRLKDQNECSLDEGLNLDDIGFVATTVAYLQPDNGIAKTPYCILIDNAWKTVILAIRGTASFEDVVIDLCLTPSKMDGVGRRCQFNGTNQFCHKGVLARCRWLYDDLERHKLLNELLLGKEPRCPKYRLMVTGHSLGAGCAAVLSLMLRHRFPTLQCYAFCPPGGLLTERLAEECEDFVISVVNDTDIIPRMSHDNLEKLRDEAFEILTRVRVSKLTMIRFFSKPCSEGQLAAMNAKVLCDKDDIPTNTEFYTSLETFKATKYTQREQSTAIRVPLYPPGKIMYLVKSKNLIALGFRTMNNKYTPQWAEKTDFNEILMARTVGHDHSADVVEENLASLLRTFEGKETDADLVHSVIDDDDEVDLMSRRESLLLVENNFVCCSLPQGMLTLIPAVLGLISLVLTALSNNWCSFVSRTTSVRVDGAADICNQELPDQVGMGVSAGLWSYLDKEYSGSGPRDDPASYVDTDLCLPFPPNFQPDEFLFAARMFSTLCGMFGGGALIASWFASCQSFTAIAWYRISACFLLATSFQGLVFLIFHSNLCTELTLGYSGCNVVTTTTCSIGWGAKIGIIAGVLWFGTAVSAARCGHSVGRKRFSLTKIKKRYVKTKNRLSVWGK